MGKENALCIQRKAQSYVFFSSLSQLTSAEMADKPAQQTKQKPKTKQNTKVLGAPNSLFIFNYISMNKCTLLNVSHT